MRTSPFTQPPAPTVQVTATLEPVRNLLLTLWALTAQEPGVGDAWLSKANEQLSAETEQFNRLLVDAFGSLLLAQESYIDFPSYLAALSRLPTERFQVHVAEALSEIENSQLRSEAETAASDPAFLQQRLVDHLRSLWENQLAAEWKRQTLMMNGMTRTLNETIFSQPRWQQMSGASALRFLLQTEPTEGQLALLHGVRRIVLVISPHLVGYCNRFASPDTLWVFTKFDPQWMRRDPLTRAEVLAPLSALADESRLRVLELLTEQGELRAQEIIPQLESSQGNVSRHLKQLVGAGYVQERRADGANKVYAYDETGLQRLIFKLRQLLSSHNAQSVAQQVQLETQREQVRSTVSPTLQKFLDAQGRITHWSSKLNEQQVMMEYLIDKFEPERGYNEKEVNELLQQWYLHPDFVLMRRSMVDAGILKRTKDGSRYWREANAQ
ncbi:MAG: metalloregulator ArsR/SmtB family transcription factor [Caldilineaceae bacterium]